MTNPADPASGSAAPDHQCCSHVTVLRAALTACQADLAAAQGVIARLRGYAMHKFGCGVHGDVNYPREAQPRPCDCGLADLLASLHQGGEG